ncbi:MAG: serine hydrolase [Chloroflexia bacterium]|nr:serine hydrolase [Chloroflexia bacterium]
MSKRGVWLALFLLFILLSMGTHSLFLGWEEASIRPTPTLSTTPVPVVAVDPPALLLPPGLSIAGVPLGGLTLEQAEAALERYRLRPLRRPLLLRLEQRSLYLDPVEVGLEVALAPALAAAEEYARQWRQQRWAVQLSTNGPLVGPVEPVDLPLQVDLDASALHAFLQDLAGEYDRRSRPRHQEVVTDTALLADMGVLSPTWSPHFPPRAFYAAESGRRLRVEAALEPLSAALRQWQREPLSLPTEVLEPPAPRLAVLQQALYRRAASMPGVVGLYVRDLQTGAEIGVNERVIFSGASVVKIAIMLKAYLFWQGPPSGDLEEALWLMMVYSSNEDSNTVLGVGGSGAGEDLPVQSLAMTAMLHELGLRDTCMLSPYWGGFYRGPTCFQAPPPGLADLSDRRPLTDPDAYRLTTPRDMGLLLADIYECGQGEGAILERFPEQITPAECQSMLELMLQNADRRRLLAGLPRDVPVAHKSGWISDMKADTGIVFSPAGPYVVSIFVWEEGLLPDAWGNARIAALSWLVYSFFNPF